MPVSLEQWRASVGMINAGRSRALAKCIKGSPRSGSNLDLILFLLVMAPLVMCCCVGAWLVVKWGAPVKHGQLLKRYRREDALRQCLLLGIVCCEGWLLSLQCVHGERVWPHEKHHMTCLSESSHYLSPLSSSGCGQYLNIVFHTVMVTLLYLCGDVEKNPGPLFELVPGNVDKLCVLLKDVDYYRLVAALKYGLKVPLYSIYTEKLTASEFRLEMLSWLKREKLKPPWSELISALTRIGCYDIVMQLGAESFGLQSIATGVTGAIAAAERKPAGFKEYHGHKEDSPNLETIDESSIDRDDDFADVVEAVESLAADWDKLAIKLHLKNDDIKVIRKDNPGDSQRCLHDAMELWLKENYNTERFGHPSWRTLVEAVVKMDNALACKIANEHRDSESAGPSKAKRMKLSK